MARLGVNLGRTPNVPLQDLVAHGVRTVRIVATADLSRDYVRSLDAAGIGVWLVLARESFEGFPTRSAAVQFYYNNFPKGSIFQVGNEPDIESPSSWSLSQNDLNDLLFDVASVVGSRRTLVLGGLASGDPNYLSGVDLQYVDAVALHLYGTWPDGLRTQNRQGNPWGFGYATDKVREYRTWLRDHGDGGLPINVTEVGAPSTEIQNFFLYPQEIMRSLNTVVDGDVLYFCWSDDMVPDFGIFDTNGNTKAEFNLADLRLATVPTPIVPSPVPPVDPLPTPLPAPVPVELPVLPARDSALRDLYLAYDKTLSYHPEFGIESYWLAHHNVLGPCVGPEYREGDTCYRAFVGGVVQWVDNVGASMLE